MSEKGDAIASGSTEVADDQGLPVTDELASRLERRPAEVITVPKLTMLPSDMSAEFVSPYTMMRRSVSAFDSPAVAVREGTS